MNLGPKPPTPQQARRSPCCRSYPRQARLITDRYGWQWSLHTCARCGIEYQARPMDDAARAEFYGSGRYRQVCAAVTGKPWDDLAYLRAAQGEYADRLRYEYFGECGPDGAESGSILGIARWNSAAKLLDYGGSTGVVGRAMCWPDTELTVADYGDGATTTPEQALAVPDATYDAILCCQTLDHLREPLTTLEAFHRVAKPGARLFVDVVKLAHTAYKIDHDWYAPSGSAFLALVERAGWSVLWLDAETNATHYSVLAEKA